MKKKKEYTLSERLRYLFDKYMAKGTISVISLLVVATIVVVLIVSFVIYIFDGIEGATFFETLWDSFAYTVNAWFPFTSDVETENEIGFLIPTAIAAIMGLLFTSVLIGIVSTAIEDKVSSLRKGNSSVIEDDHIIVLGYSVGNHELLKQLILAQAGKASTIVIGDQVEKDEIEDDISDNIDIPNNITIICRNIDITDPVSVVSLGLVSAKTVVISPMEDKRTIMVILSCVNAIKQCGNEDIKVISSIADNRFALPLSMNGTKNVITLRMENIIARLISLSASQPGISRAFSDVFDFEGAEFYSSHFDGLGGKTFEEFCLCLTDASPVGIIKNGYILVAPDKDTVIDEEDDVIFFSESRKSARLVDRRLTYSYENSVVRPNSSDDHKIVILGVNEILDDLLNTLPYDRSFVSLILKGSQSFDEGLSCHNFVDVIESGLEHFNTDDILRYLKNADHVIILCDRTLDEDDADLDIMLTLVRLMDLRRKGGLDISITALMNKESNRRLISDLEPTDLIVASDLTSMILSQITESPELRDFFNEITSDEGHDLIIKEPDLFGLNLGQYEVIDLRMRLFAFGYCLIGLYPADPSDDILLNPPVDGKISISEGDRLIVIGIC